MMVDETTFYELVGYVAVSSYKTDILRLLKTEDKTPMQISRELDIVPQNVSTILKQLKMKDLVICVNEEKSKGRIYSSTQLGIDVITRVDDRRV